MAWQPVFAAGVINGIGHWWGYRNYETQDISTNIVPWGILIGGEELHNNHHAFASSAKMSVKPWEFDIGWAYIRVFEFLPARPGSRSFRPRWSWCPASWIRTSTRSRPSSPTASTSWADYAKSVLSRVYAEEIARIDSSQRGLLESARSLLMREESMLSREARLDLERARAHSDALETVYRYKHQLQAVWQQRHATHEHLVEALREWCRQAEESGVRALEELRPDASDVLDAPRERRSVTKNP